MPETNDEAAVRLEAQARVSALLQWFNPKMLMRDHTGILNWVVPVPSSHPPNILVRLDAIEFEISNRTQYLDDDLREKLFAWRQELEAAVAQSG